jgi:hypothetical protein
MIRSKLISIVLLFFLTQCLYAQDILKALESESVERSLPIIATFKGTHISIGHSVETRKKGALEISWMNRFWNRRIPQGQTTQTFAADKLNSRVGFDYSLSDRFTLGSGYVSGYRSVDAYGKYRIFYQENGKNAFPVSITALQKVVFRGKSSIGDMEVSDSDKFATISQLLLARKISKNFSVQIAPSFIYRGEERARENVASGRFALGFGGRYKVGNHVSIVSEYYYVPNPVEFIDTFGAFSLGANWEISDLLLQFKLTNARNLAEDKTIIKTENNFNFRDGNLHFGFHATYFIQL